MNLGDFSGYKHWGWRVRLSDLFSIIHINSMLWNFICIHLLLFICISVFSPWIWAHHRKPFVPRHSQSLPGARWNQKAFKLHARQSSRWAAQFFGQNKIFYWSILTWNTCHVLGHLHLDPVVLLHVQCTQSSSPKDLGSLWKSEIKWLPQVGCDVFVKWNIVILKFCYES